VFIASPGGLDDERKACRQTLADFNESHALRRNVAFIAHGWEDVPGALGRPQELINGYVRESDYLVMIVGDRLGSPTTVEPPFLTGIEEELVEALTCVGSLDPCFCSRRLIRSDSSRLTTSCRASSISVTESSDLRRRFSTPLRPWTTSA
jgi:hypothetical protein